MGETKKELPPELKAILEKTKVAKLEGTEETILLFYLKDDLREFVKEVLPLLRKGKTLTLNIPSEIPEFSKVQVWMEREEVYFHQYHPIYHPDGERVLIVENLEVRYPNYPHAKDSYIIRVFWGKED